MSGVWLLLIGAFVFQLSRAGYQQTLLRLATADTRVSDIMYTDVPVIDAEHDPDRPAEQLLRRLPPARVPGRRATVS